MSEQLNKIILSRLQTGMRGAYGKAHGTAARVRIGQILMSVRSYDKYKVAHSTVWHGCCQNDETFHTSDNV